MIEWISVKDRLPKIGLLIIFYRKGGYYSFGIFTQDHTFKETGEYYEYRLSDVSHWSNVNKPEDKP